MNLTEHFTLEELVASETAARRGIDNTPSPEIIENLQRLAVRLEYVRQVIGKPILVTSGYRCPALNRAVGGSKTSAHKFGRAADIIAPTFGTPLELCRKIAGIPQLDFDQIIHEFPSPTGGGWCHVGFAAPEATPRRELLTILSAKTGYQEGLLSA